jgi:hypothetical protein
MGRADQSSRRVLTSVCITEGGIGTSAMSWPTHTRAVEPWKINIIRTMK